LFDENTQNLKTSAQIITAETVFTTLRSKRYKFL